MYLFPTKALAEDQLHEFHADGGRDGRRRSAPSPTTATPRRTPARPSGSGPTWCSPIPTCCTPGSCRTTPAGRATSRTCSYVVIDELHYYRGVYGSHLANLLRRLRRICEFYDSKPQFICCSATIANPLELAEALTGESFELVERNGAPRGEKFFIFYNPPVVNRQLGIRRSYIARDAADGDDVHRARPADAGLRQQPPGDRGARHLPEGRLRQRARCRATRCAAIAAAICRGSAARSSADLREGKMRAVVATNALELGIDIGSLDAVVMAGYPGTIASSWQRAGRAGRRQGASAAVLVASSAPLDQYIVEHPDYFFGRSPEHAYINADNLEILLAHLKCAAFELPIREGEKFGGHDTGELCRFLEEAGFLHHSAGAWHWTQDTLSGRRRQPARRHQRQLRGGGYHRRAQGDRRGRRSRPRSPRCTRRPSISTKRDQYHVERFDYDERKAYVKSVDCDYYTDAIDYTQVKVLQEFESGAARSGARRAHGDVRVNRQIVGFKKIKFYTMENVGAGKLSMPEQEMHTTAFWLHFPAAFLARFAEFTPTEKQAGIIGLGQRAAHGGRAAADVRSARSRAWR